MFDYDWFFGPALEEQREQACLRCAFKAFPDLTPGEATSDEHLQQYLEELDCRLLIYLRDGAIYEAKEFVEARSKVHLTFECEPAEERYRVGSFIVGVPYEEIVRVEVFAVHPSQKPNENTVITGFKHAPEGMPPSREEIRFEKLTPDQGPFA